MYLYNYYDNMGMDLGSRELPLTQAREDLNDILDLARDRRVHHHQVQFSANCIMYAFLIGIM